MNSQLVGANGSEVKLNESKTVRVTAKVAARLDELPNEAIHARGYD